jgi:hypothetical protein
MTMAHDLNLLDRARIERVVWSLDQRLYDLPRRVRIAHRRELRDNLTAAARDVGTSAALRDLGDAATLATAYRDAQLGARPRPAWTAAALFLLTTTLVLTSLLFEASTAFGDGILAGNSEAQGTYHWAGIAHLQNEVTYTVADGAHTFVGGSFSLLTWALLAVGFLLISRAWRALPARTDRQRDTTPATP